MKASVKSMTAPGLLLMALFFASCSKKEEGLTPAQIQARADSILKARLPALQQRAKEDYEKRLPIELKPKVDSILKIGNPVGPVPVFPEDDIPAAAPGHHDTATKPLGDSVKSRKER